KRRGPAPARQTSTTRCHTLCGTSMGAADERERAGGDRRGVQTIPSSKICLTPDGAREIGAEPDASKNARDDTRLHARFGNRSPEPAVYRVLLDGQNPAGLSRRPQYGVRVERLHSVHAQHSTGNATDPQLVGGGERDAEDATSGDEREVLALPKSTRASELKGLIRAACIGRRRLVESEVRGSRGIRDCFG